MPETRHRSELRVGNRMSFGHALHRIATQYPDRLAIADGIREVSFEELDVRVTRLASGLQARGVSKGDRVLVLAMNRVEFMESLYATARLGAIVVPVNFRFVADEIRHAIEDSDPVLVIAQHELLPQLRAALAGREIPLVVFDETEEGAEAFEAVIAGSQVTDRFPEVSENEPFVILYTSGTTGRPKGVVLDHLSFVLNSVFRAQGQGLASGDEVAYVGIQLFHCGGLNPAVMTHLIGGTLVLAGVNRTPEQIVEALDRYGVTMCSLVPTQWQRMLEVEGVERRHFLLRRISWGASAADQSLLNRMKAVFGDLPVATVYGQTETAGATLLLESRGGTQVGAIGRPMPHVETRVVDETMADVPTGSIGELVYRGPSVMQGYWHNEEANRAAFFGGWLHSGDLVRVDGEGCYWIAGRRKELIVSGGENIYPAEVERVILLHEGVRDVAVVGRPHELWGETPVAFIVPANDENPPSAEEVIALCQLHLASYKKPTAVYRIKELPRNSAGKVKGFLLRDGIETGE